MAKIKLGAFVTEIAGKVGGSIFSRNRGGAYVKNRVIPSNPKTPAQNAVRSAFGSIAQSWRSLTKGQRAAWNSATANYQIVDSLGDIRTLSGAQLFQQLNLNLNAVDVRTLLSPAQPQGAPNNEFDIASMTSEDFSIETTKIADGSLIEVFATPSLSPGVSNVSNQLRKIGVFTVQDVVPTLSIGEAYTAKFGDLVDGSTVGVSLRSVNSITGEASTKNTLTQLAG